MRTRVLFLVASVATFVSGCGGGGGGSTTSTFRGISINPSSISLKPSESVQLTAVVDGGTQAVSWSLPDATSGSSAQGSFVEPGKYKAPVASGNYRVRATLVGDATKYADATANVDSGYVVTISSSGTANVAFGGTKTFTATVSGASSNEVVWSATVGSITSGGLYTAPESNAVTSAVITATSSVDPGKKKTFNVNMVPAIEIENASATRYAVPQSRFTFKAIVAGSPATSGVNWTASSGTITSAGVWTADSSTLGDVTITATLASDSTKSVSSTVSVQSNLNVRFKFSTAGDIVLGLRPDKAPRHCANLVSLVNEKFYDGIKLHRREENFVVQWGDPLTKTLPLTDSSIGTGGPGYTINFEANDLKHLKYALGMARSSSLDSAGSQIYLCLADLPSLDTNYVVFGSVLSGQTAVDGIQKGDTIQSATVELVPAP
jgi:cyclophilin family peptidyl-prolyl cis-trans isomerase